ncbi:MAG: chromosome segregation protein SMC [Bacteroidetes bacterium]|nr:MAG: chromosome segregation protein SMC [Bacteroidota bacterium]
MPNLHTVTAAIQKIIIRNFKSIYDLEIELGRFNVLVGANGSGKSNILEAIAFGAAAAAEKLDHEFLGSRGIRYTEPPLMRSGFELDHTEKPIELRFFRTTPTPHSEPESVTYRLANSNKPYAKWMDMDRPEPESGSIAQEPEIDYKLPFQRASFGRLTGLSSFIIFSPEESALRKFEEESQILPLGVKGEGLFKLLKVFSRDTVHRPLEELINHLRILDWFDGFDIGNGAMEAERKLNIRDRYLDDALAYFDQRSANEGFLYLLFYLSLFISKDTPSFFGIDNIEVAFNPKLCTKLMLVLNELSLRHGKQVIFTTHNPAVLDGINLHDDSQRLFVVDRNIRGHTKVKRIRHKPGNGAEASLKLSEAFMKGYLGGLPKNF